MGMMAGVIETERESCEMLLLACRILDRKGVLDSSGHLSFRVPGTDNFVIPARQAPGLATMESLMVIGPDGDLLEGEGTVPLEWPIHGRIYRVRPDVSSVLHSHSPMSRAFSISKVPLNPVFGIASPWFNRPLPIHRATSMIGSAELGDALAETLGDGPAVLLRAHGSVVVGPSIDATAVRAATLEDVALSLLRAAAIGEVDWLTDEEMAAWHDSTPSGHRKAWEYLMRTVEGADR